VVADLCYQSRNSPRAPEMTNSSGKVCGFPVQKQNTAVSACHRPWAIDRSPDSTTNDTLHHTCIWRRGLVLLTYRPDPHMTLSTCRRHIGTKNLFIKALYNPTLGRIWGCRRQKCRMKYISSTLYAHICPQPRLICTVHNVFPTMSHLRVVLSYHRCPR
jgi:hypothetical protein